ncbi:MAG: hypothetical protein IPM46_05220 [Flavobacteriales bacterium]|nr:hypothetical protein [Flavobacteriales bacterium]
MRTHVWILSVMVVLGATACGDAENKSTPNVHDGVSATVVDDRTVVVDEAAIARRSTRIDGMASCIRLGNADTWKELSLTTDQIRWMEELQGRMVARNEKTTASVDKDHGETAPYTFSAAERRKLAEILTDDQLEQWTAMCPDQAAVSRLQ